MELSGNTVLITGGASGIGFAFAERFIKAGNTVIVCGRRESKLKEAKEKHPELITRVCDVAVQQRYHILKADVIDNWADYNKEITVNMEAPIHLAMLFSQCFAEKAGKTAIINVSSGLAFTPMAVAPIYSSTKAALHSFTMSLRHQLSEAGVEVIEVAPPAVNTDLGGVGLHDSGAPLDEFADAIFKGLEEGRLEIGYAVSEKALRMSRDEIDESVSQLYSSLKHSIE